MNYTYLVIDAAVNEEMPVVANDKESAMKFAKQILEQNARVEGVAIYKLQKIGKRQNTVAWEEPTSEKLKVRAKNKGKRPWTEQDVTYMLKARRAGVPYETIAENLGRTEKAISIRYYRAQLEGLA